MNTRTQTLEGPISTFKDYAAHLEIEEAAPQTPRQLMVSTPPNIPAVLWSIRKAWVDSHMRYLELY
jgi:hypothetical protein